MLPWAVTLTSLGRASRSLLEGSDPALAMEELGNNLSAVTSKAAEFSGGACAGEPGEAPFDVVPSRVLRGQSMPATRHVAVPTGAAHVPVVEHLYVFFGHAFSMDGPMLLLGTRVGPWPVRLPHTRRSATHPTFVCRSGAGCGCGGSGAVAGASLWEQGRCIAAPGARRWGGIGGRRRGTGESSRKDGYGENACVRWPVIRVVSSCNWRCCKQQRGCFCCALVCGPHCAVQGPTADSGRTLVFRYVGKRAPYDGSTRRARLRRIVQFPCFGHSYDTSPYRSGQFCGERGVHATQLQPITAELDSTTKSAV